MQRVHNTHAWYAELMECMVCKTVQGVCGAYFTVHGLYGVWDACCIRRRRMYVVRSSRCMRCIDRVHGT
jgi:hypothetical protein